MIDDAQQILREIDAYLETGKNPAVADQLTANKISINKSLECIRKTEYSAAFIGKIGAGKTSALCKVSGLQYRSAAGDIVDILKTGAGRTTVCEVRIEYAEKYSIKVDPLADSEVKRTVRNFAEFMWAKSNKGISEEEEGGSLLSEELTRCIRNMLGLTIEKQKNDLKWKSIDRALEFSRSCQSVDEVNDLMFDFLALEARTQTEIFPNTEESRDWKSWIKESFARINDGKNKNISIPATITICGPFPLQKGDCTWKIIDTRGIDSNIYREDIREIIDTEGVFPVVCSSFVDAPDADCRSFFALAISLGQNIRLSRDSLLLVLDKNESDKVADIEDEITNLAERKDMGRGIREDQVTTRIEYDYKIQSNIITFDSHQDDEKIIWDALEARKSAYLTSRTRDLEMLVSASREILSAEGNKVSDFTRDISALIEEWRIGANSRVPDWNNFAEDVRLWFSDTHHKTLAASIDREGDFYNLNIYESVNQLARAKTISFCKNEMRDIKKGLFSLKSKYPEFENQINSIAADFSRQFEKFSTDVGKMAKDHWIERVKSSVPIWKKMKDEWGLGGGYKRRVLDHWKNWEHSSESISIHDLLLRHIASVWAGVLAENTG